MVWIISGLVGSGIEAVCRSLGAGKIIRPKTNLSTELGRLYEYQRDRRVLAINAIVAELDAGKSWMALPSMNEIMYEQAAGRKPAVFVPPVLLKEFQTAVDGCQDFQFESVRVDCCHTMRLQRCHYLSSSQKQRRDTVGRMIAEATELEEFNRYQFDLQYDTSMDLPRLMTYSRQFDLSEIQ